MKKLVIKKLPPGFDIEKFRKEFDDYNNNLNNSMTVQILPLGNNVSDYEMKLILKMKEAEELISKLSGLPKESFGKNEPAKYNKDR